jgi:hypothetical protein
LVIDITDNTETKLPTLCSFIGGNKKDITRIHANQTSNDKQLSNNVLSYIDTVMGDIQQPNDYNQHLMKTYMGNN